MDLEQVKRAFSLTSAKKDDVDRKVDEISLMLVKQKGSLQSSLLDELHELETQQNHLKDHVAQLRQQLSKRGLTTSEINAIPKATLPSDQTQQPPLEAFAFPSTPKQAPPFTNEKKLLETIDHERYHQQHIEEVERWNQQEAQRQQAIREQNLKLLQLHEQLQQMKISEEQKIAQQKLEVAREQEALRQREKELNEQQKQQIRMIDEKLAELRNERTRLAGNQQQLSVGQQEQLEELQAKRRAILNAGGSDNSWDHSGFPTAPGNLQSVHESQIQCTIARNSPHDVPQDQFAQQRAFPSDNPHLQGNPIMQGQGNPQMQGYNTAQPHMQGQHNPGMTQGQNIPNNGNYSSVNQMRQSMPSAYSNLSSDNPEISAWKQEQDALQNWQQQSATREQSHQEKLKQQEQEYMQSLRQREDALRSQWTQELTQQQAQVEQERSQVHQQLTDDMLCRMSEAELRMWMNHAQKNQFIDEMLARRQRLLDEQAWLLQQDLENKNMALSFREDDLRKKEWEIEQQREAERRALARVFCIIVETTNPEGKRTGKTYQMQVRAGDSMFRICERIPHDKELFCVRMDYNGRIIEDLDKNLLELEIPDNAFMIARLLPKADVDVLNLIPCEDCGKRYHAEVFGAHKCMKNYSQELPSQRKSQARGSQQSRTVVARQQPTQRRVVTQQPKRQEVIPCEYCEGLFPPNRYESHLKTCSSRTSVPRVTRYRYY